MKLSERLAELVGRAVMVPPEDDTDRCEILREVRDIYGELVQLELTCNSDASEELELESKVLESENDELARLKSSGQWAVTCEGMTEADAKTLVENYMKFALNGPTLRAVPLHAPEDGPWVIKHGLGKYILRAAGAIEGTFRTFYTPDIDSATRYTTDELSDALEGMTGNYYPVRLSNVSK